MSNDRQTNKVGWIPYGIFLTGAILSGHIGWVITAIIYFIIVEIIV